MGQGKLQAKSNLRLDIFQGLLKLTIIKENSMNNYTLFTIKIEFFSILGKDGLSN